MPLAVFLTALLGVGLVWAQSQGNKPGQTATHKPGQGAEGPQARRLPPPALVAPPLLEAQAPGDRRIATRELEEGGVMVCVSFRDIV